jgi:NAD(P)-dependent dehydrogenase (short-subunit alcohol dehydrogenase family)
MRTVLIRSGASGMGLAMARRFLNGEYRVVLGDIAQGRTCSHPLIAPLRGDCFS